MAIRSVKELVREAEDDLKDLQSKGYLLKTGMDFIDSHLGGLIGGDDVVTIAALSGDGKSHIMARIRDNILNSDLNRDRADFIWLDYNYEMQMKRLLVREIYDKTGKKKSKILTSAWENGEEETVKSVIRNMSDDRYFMETTPDTVEDWYKKTNSFLAQYKDKAAVCITIDHVLLFKGQDKSANLSNLSLCINKLKKDYKNAYFFLLSQLNRGLASRADDMNNHAAPKNLDIFGSSELEFISSYMIMSYQPYRKGISKYMRVSGERYEYLSDFFHVDGIDGKGKASFETQGNVFYHCEKVRDSDDIYKNIYVHKYNKFEKPEDRPTPEKTMTTSDERRKNTVFDFDPGDEDFEFSSNSPF
jgi:replicative DNA helicase